MQGNIGMNTQRNFPFDNICEICGGSGGGLEAHLVCHTCQGTGVKGVNLDERDYLRRTESPKVYDSSETVVE